jgi:hypothetical protein
MQHHDQDSPETEIVKMAEAPFTRGGSGWYYDENDMLVLSPDLLPSIEIAADAATIDEPPSDSSP